MQIVINGERSETAARTLAELCESLGYDAGYVATALNEAFVPVKARIGTMLSAGDRVEIVSPRQGG